MPQTSATAATAVTLPVDLSNIDDIIESYLDERADPAWFDPYTAGSRCHIASEDFVAWARTQGYSAEMVERHDTPGFCGEHTAARIGPFVFDPTSAQLPHTLGVSGETVDYDPAVHRPTRGWYGIIPAPQTNICQSLKQALFLARRMFSNMFNVFCWAAICFCAMGGNSSMGGMRWLRIFGEALAAICSS